MAPVLVKLGPSPIEEVYGFAVLGFIGHRGCVGPVTRLEWLCVSHVNDHVVDDVHAVSNRGGVDDFTVFVAQWGQHVAWGGFAHFVAALCAVFAGLATVGSLLGVYVLLLVEALWLQLLLAVVMIWYVGRAWLRPAPLQVSTMPVWQLNSLGFLAGVVGSATNAMAPILMIALLAMNKDRRETIQVANLCFILSKLCQFVGMYVGGQWLFTWQDTDILLAVCAVALLFWFVGFKWQQRLSPVLFQKVVLLMLVAMAVLQLWQSLPLLWLKIHA